MLARAGAEDRILATLDTDFAALVYTSDSALRARVHALGAEVAGARALLDETAAVHDD